MLALGKITTTTITTKTTNERMTPLQNKFHCLSPAATNTANNNQTEISIPFDISTNISLLLNPFICMFVLTTNLLLIWSFYKKSRPFSVTTRLFIVLAVIGIVKAFQFAMTVAESAGVFMTTCDQFFGLLAFNHFIFSLDVAVYCTISILRYLSIRYPLGGKHLPKFVLPVELFFCFIHGVAMFFIYQKVKAQYILDRFTIGFSVFFSLILMLVLVVNLLSYTHLNRTNSVLEKEKNNRDSASSTGNDNTTQQSVKRKQHAIKTLFILTSLYWICYLPFTITMVLQSSTLQINITEKPLVLVTLVSLSMVNGGLNSLVIIIRTKNLRECFSLKFNCN